MPKTYDYKNQPYCYGFDSKTNTEILFGRDYQPLARRRLLHNEVEQIAHYPNRGQHPMPCHFGPYLEHDFAGWFNDDGNPPRYNKTTRKHLKVIWTGFLSGEEVRDYLYNVDRTYQFPDRLIEKRYKGVLGASSPFGR